MTGPSIFVAIPAYRDPELVPTVLDLFARASRPDRVRVGICWQHAPGDDLGPLRGDPRVAVLEVDHRSSGGMGWARAQTLQLYGGQDYYLQVDSHQRFAPGWDDTLLDQLGRAPADKPLLSSWCPGYVPGSPPPATEPLRMRFDTFDSFGMPSYDADPITDWRSRDEPVPTGHVCGHFMFAQASFIAEVPNDPNVYFYGEEVSTAVRAFTWGWDVFAPVRTVMWHLYDGTTRVRHWDDHTDPAEGRTWHQRELASRRRVRNLLLHPGPGRYGVGPLRTVAEYEAYAGISFAEQRFTVPAPCAP
jgi:Glycosyltransferase (GlcNAc)